MQLSPHTLFNLLNTIRGLIKSQPDTAREMVVQLSDLLRRLLSAGQRDFCFLSEELQFAGLYLELQRQRFSDRLSIDLPDPSDQPPVWLPSLITQPLVENAVVHGLAGHDAPVEVRIEAQLLSDCLTIRITNTIADGRVGGRESIGVSNVRERLRVQFGSRARLSTGPDGPTRWISELKIPAVREYVPTHGEPQRVDL